MSESEADFSGTVFPRSAASACSITPYSPLFGFARAVFTSATSVSPTIDRGCGSVSPEYPENAVALVFGALPIVHVLSAE